MSLLCLDVGGSSIKFALVNAAGELSREGKIPTPTSDFDAFAAAVKSIVDSFADANVQGVGMSLPGRIDSRRGHCFTGGYLNYNAGRDVGPELEEVIGLPVVLENDGKAACRAEMWHGALQGVTNGAVLVLGTGLGGGIVVNSQLVSGVTGAAGELSFWIADITRPITTATMASNIVSCSGLQIFAAEEYGLPYELDFVKGYKLPFDGKQIFDKAAAGEAPALRAIERLGECTGRLIYNLCTVLDCEKIAIGGGISVQPSLLKAVQRGLDLVYADYPLPPSTNAITKPEVACCTFFNGANLIGAAHAFIKLHPMRKVFD